MVGRVGFKNIQIQSKKELADTFEDIYNQSGANSKAEFLGILIDNYLNPDTTISKKAEVVEREKEDLSAKIQLVEEENANLKEEKDKVAQLLSHYEDNDILKRLFSKHDGKKLSFKNTEGKRIALEVKEIKDVFTAVMNSILI